MAVRRISLDRSDENIIQPFDKQVDVKQILDSDSSSLSLTMSTEDTVEREQLSHQSRPASQGNDLPLPNNDELSEETIITASFHIWTERHIHLPKVFDKTGRLRPQYRHLKVKLSAATEQRMRQVAADKQLQLQQIHSLLESPVGFPAGFNISVSQAASEDPQRVTTKKSQIPSQTGDPNLSSPHQPSDVLDRSPSHSRFNKKVDFDGSTPQVNNSLPTKATFSTQTKKRCSNPSTYHRSKNTLSCPRKAQKVAGQQNPGKSLQSGPAPNLAEQEAFQSLPKPNITPDQSNAHRIQAYPKVLYSLSRTSSLASPEGLSRLQCPERIIDHPLGAKRQIAYQPQPTRTEPMLPSPSAREQAIAARVLHERIQQQQSRNSETCNNCRKNSCSCNATQQPIEKILCSDNDCFRKWWGVDDLQKCCGIKLSDARETKQNFKCWFCPECSKKAQVLLNAVPTRAPLSPSRDPRTIVPNASGHPGPEDCAWPEDAEIREPLQALTGILQQYTGTTTMARNHSSQINPHTSILDIPCIRGETLQSAGTAHNVICILRRLLDVPDAVLIRDKVTEAKLQHISCSVCLRGILSYLITDFIFYAGSPFEDTSLWSKVLTDSGHSPHQAGSLIHNYRIRLMKAHQTNPEDPLIPREFRERLYGRRQAFMEGLNVTMLPLVGGDNEVQARHKKIAKIASELNLKVFAYRGTFVQINPCIKEPFDLEYHTEENPELEDLAGQPILLTTMMGIKYEHPEKGWRTYCPARTNVWLANNTLRHRAARVPLPDMPQGNPPNQTTRIVPKKRRVADAV